MAKVAIVTGGNQGLGLALVRGLCRTLGADGIVYLTARDRGRGEQAVSSLQAADGLSPRLELLDVRDGSSVQALARTIADRHGGADIVISNAAARISPQMPDAAGPGLRRHQQPRHGPHDQGVRAAPQRRRPVAAVKVLARELVGDAARRDILVNAACPGLVDTAASRPWFDDMSGALSLDEAAADILWLATLPAGTRQPYGGLIQHRKILRPRRSRIHADIPGDQPRGRTPLSIRPRASPGRLGPSRADHPALALVVVRRSGLMVMVGPVCRVGGGPGGAGNQPSWEMVS
jgi:NAD(P)-dependent dehydrogenase (short-subunit alcohol dehydrogenase family)